MFRIQEEEKLNANILKMNRNVSLRALIGQSLNLIVAPLSTPIFNWTFFWSSIFAFLLARRIGI